MRDRQINSYWESRRNQLFYYQVVRSLADALVVNAKSIIDVGSNNCPYLDWFEHIPQRTSIDLRFPYMADGVESIKQDFIKWEPVGEYDAALCLQVLEHVPDPGAFAQKLLSVAKVVIISVPYKWKAGRTKGHIHDPVDESKLLGWFQREPNFRYVCQELIAGNRKRLIQVYERNDIKWNCIRQRETLLRETRRTREPLGKESVI